MKTTKYHAVGTKSDIKMVERVRYPYHTNSTFLGTHFNNKW